MKRARLSVALMAIGLVGGGARALDPVIRPAFDVAATTSVGAPLKVVHDGSSWLVLGREEAVLVDANGLLVANIPLPAWPLFRQFLSAGFDGTNYLLVWFGTEYVVDPGSMMFPFPVDRSVIFGTRVSRGGLVLDPSPIRISRPESCENPMICERVSPLGADVAFDGSNSLVVWNYRTAVGEAVFGARVSPGGTVLDPGGLPVSGIPVPYDMTQVADLHPSAAFDGTNYLVVWNRTLSTSEPWELRGARIARDGTLLDPDSFLISQLGSPNNYVHANGATGYPQIAFDGENYVVAWLDWPSAGWGSEPPLRVDAARVAVSGQVLDPGGIPLSQGAATTYRSLASAFDGLNHLVLWSDAPDLHWRPLGTNGAPVGVPSELLLADAAGAAIGTDGSGNSLLAAGYESTSGPRVRGWLLTTWAQVSVSLGGSGAGRVISAPPGIDCGGSCSAAFGTGTEVTLTATATAGSRFAGWSGACTGTSSCVVSVDGAKSVAAQFDRVYAPPSVRAVTPRIGPTAGGTVITIAGRDFQAGAKVTVGGVAATVKFVDDKKLKAITPPHWAGYYTVTVVNPDGQRGSLPRGFRYIGGAAP